MWEKRKERNKECAEKRKERNKECVGEEERK